MHHVRSRRGVLLRRHPVVRRDGTIVATVRHRGRRLACLVVISVVTTLSTTACSSVACKAYAAAGLIVNVRDVSGNAVCDAAVTATDGDHSEPLMNIAGEGSSCMYVGAYERRGTYSIEARAPDGRSARIDGVLVTADQCHVRPVTTTITLGG